MLGKTSGNRIQAKLAIIILCKLDISTIDENLFGALSNEAGRISTYYNLRIPGCNLGD